MKEGFESSLEKLGQDAGEMPGQAAQQGGQENGHNSIIGAVQRSLRAAAPHVRAGEGCSIADECHHKEGNSECVAEAWWSRGTG